MSYAIVTVDEVDVMVWLRYSIKRLYIWFTS